MTQSWGVKRAGAGGIKDVLFVLATAVTFSIANTILPTRPAWVIGPILVLAFWRVWAIAGLGDGLLERLWNRSLGETYAWSILGTLFWLAMARGLTNDPAIGPPSFVRWGFLCWYVVILIALWRAAGKYTGARPWLARFFFSGVWFWPLLFLLMRRDGALDGNVTLSSPAPHKSAAAEITVEQLTKDANQGSTSAQYDLAFRYLRGNGVSRDDSQAETWMRKSANGGLAAAQFGLAKMYRSGRGVEQDPEQALAWYRRAADQGMAEAQFSLAILYAGGDVPRDNVQAAIWARRAADQGLSDGQYFLGLLYLSGTGVTRDRDAAIVWLRAAANNGHAEAQKTLADLKP